MDVPVLTGLANELNANPIAPSELSWAHRPRPASLRNGHQLILAFRKQKRRGKTPAFSNSCLADQALGVWLAPKLDTATLAAYQPEKVPATGGYTINDHPNLLTSGMREVFEAFRKGP